MKKLLGISLVAALAVSPMMAMAANELGAAVTLASGKTATGDALATSGYVKGAFNASLTEIGKVNDAVTLLNNNDSTAGSVLHAVKTKAADASYSNESMANISTIGDAITNVDSRIDTLESTANGLATNYADVNLSNLSSAGEAVISTAVTNGAAGASYSNASMANISTIGDAITNVDSRIDTLESTVGDSTAGLVADVADLQTTVGDSTTGLVKDVADLQGSVGALGDTYATKDQVLATIGASTISVVSNWETDTPVATAVITAPAAVVTPVVP